MRGFRQMSVLKSMCFISALSVSMSLFAQAGTDEDSVKIQSEMGLPDSQAGSEVRSLGPDVSMLLRALESTELRPVYEELNTLGQHIDVLVQSLPPQRQGETDTTRFTLTAWKQTGFTTRRKVATMTIDRYSKEDIMDASPDFYRVSLLHHQDEEQGS